MAGTTNLSLEDHNGWADFWRYKIGVNVIPADSRNKRPLVTWAEWQTNPIPQSLHDEWKFNDMFEEGLAIVLGKVWHRADRAGYYLFAIDTDNQTATMALSISPDRTIVEHHPDNPVKRHYLAYARRAVKDKSSDIGREGIDDASQVPIAEVKCERRILYCTPGYHKDGQRYRFIGQNEPCIIDDVDGFERTIDEIFRRYGLNYLDGDGASYQKPIEELFKEGAKIFEGNNRHLGLLRAMESLIKRNKGILSLEEIRQNARQWNNRVCSPPLDDREFEKQWYDATKFIASKKNNDSTQEEETESDKRRKKVAEALEVLECDDKYHFVTFEETDEILFYENGVYNRGGEVVIREFIEDRFGKDASISLCREVLDHIRRLTYHKRDEFDSDVNVINLSKGLYHILEDRLESHRHDYLSLNQKPIAYDAQAVPKRFIRFLNEVVYTSDVDTLVDLMGYTFYRDNPLEIIIYLHGFGGKR